MYANFLKYLFREIIYWKQKGNFKNVGGILWFHLLYLLVFCVGGILWFHLLYLLVFCVDGILWFHLLYLLVFCVDGILWFHLLYLLVFWWYLLVDDRSHCNVLSVRSVQISSPQVPLYIFVDAPNRLPRWSISGLESRNGEVFYLRNRTSVPVF